MKDLTVKDLKNILNKLDNENLPIDISKLYVDSPVVKYIKDINTGEERYTLSY